MVPPSLLSERLPSGFRGRVAGIYRVVIDVGSILGPALTGFTIERWGFQAAAGLVAAVLSASIGLSAAFVGGWAGRGMRGGSG